jgi:thymidylate kinase
MNGHWISIEGINGAGKRNLLEALKRRLQSRGIEVESLSRYLIPELVILWKQLVRADAVDQRQAAVLAAADAVVGYSTLIRPALLAGKWVIMDGFTTAHKVLFQQRGVPSSELDALFGHVPLPDQVFYLHTPVADALQRGREQGSLDPWTIGLDSTGLSIGQAWATRTLLTQTQMEAAFITWQAGAQSLYPRALPADRSLTLSGSAPLDQLVEQVMASLPLGAAD